MRRQIAYDLKIWLSLYPKKIGGKTYWYLREMARVDGKPKMVSERYLGTAAEIEALLDAREAAVMPERTRHLAFGDVAAAWGMLDELGVIGVIDQAAGPRRRGSLLSTGTYLALAALNRLVAPCSKAGFAEWWKTTAADRFAKIPRLGAGSPPVLGRDARRHPGPSGAGLPRDRGADRAGLRGGCVVSGAGHDQLRYLHRHAEWPGRRSRSAARPSRSAPTCAWSGWGWW